MIPFPDKKYSIIYADPPWEYSDKSLSHGGGAESHYPCMKTKDICDLPIPTISEDNSVLLMWTTYPQLEEAFKVITSWGFKYKTGAFTWVKSNQDGTIYMGMGRYTRANAEICLLSTKGKGLERKNAGVMNTVILKRMKHSEKPQYFRNQIVKLFGDVSRIELFSRNKIEGWDCWGNEVPTSEQRLLNHEDL